MLGVSSQPGQATVGKVSQESSRLVGSFGQIRHVLGGQACFVVKPGLQGRTDGLVQQLDG